MTSIVEKINKKINIKERGILFNTEMVRAVLSGNKTQTRRIVKDVYAVSLENDDKTVSMFRFNSNMEFPIKIECPYGKVGDLLYVRETYCLFYFDNMQHAYKADVTKYSFEDIPEPKWIPSIHMKKEHSRIWLKIKSVKFERIQDISDDDIRSEGVTRSNSDEYLRDNFRIMWDDLYKFNGFGMNINPYVWVVEFERIEK